ncbi:cytoplasmic protein [Leclercia sp.]|uniref:cytoplasmic protein n=1 Tax=Leclercia sp. TaxID=1898428 RepID=UPI0028AFFDF9|nr:cytoplasmic protein [Leclercia sp.]
MSGQSQTEKARAIFLHKYTYSSEDLAADYQAELLNYSNEKWEYPQRAARLSAAVKRYKSFRMLCFIFEIADETELDFTPLIVKRLCNRLFGRSGSQEMIVDIFGQKGRQHRSRDNLPSVIDGVVERYRLAAFSCQASIQNDIEQVKKAYQAGIMITRQQAE